MQLLNQLLNQEPQIKDMTVFDKPYNVTPVAAVELFAKEEKLSARIAELNEQYENVSGAARSKITRELKPLQQEATELADYIMEHCPPKPVSPEVVIERGLRLISIRKDHSERAIKDIQDKFASGRDGMIDVITRYVDDIAKHNYELNLIDRINFEETVREKGFGWMLAKLHRIYQKELEKHIDYSNPTWSNPARNTYEQYEAEARAKGLRATWNRNTLSMLVHLIEEQWDGLVCWTLLNPPVDSSDEEE